MIPLSSDIVVAVNQIMNRQAISMEYHNIAFPAQKPASQAAGSRLPLWAVIPVKALAGAKQRLKDCLGPYREDFTLAMLKDVLAGLADSQTLDGTAVVTSDQRVGAIAARQGLMVVDEHNPAGLNAAVDQGFEAVRRVGAGRVLIVPADIPLLTGAEVDRLFAAFEEQAGKGSDSAIGISPSTDGSGTNCLIIGERRGFAFQYGPDSFTNHCANARAHQQDVVSLPSATISLDIDEPRHVDELLAFCARHPEFQRTATWNFLHNTMGIDRQAELA